MPIHSKSQQKSYTLEHVRGSQIGRIQYFLNRELSYLLDLSSLLALVNSFRICQPEFCNLFSLKTVNGKPTVTVCPNAAQKFQRNKQAGGGAFIPPTIQLESRRKHKQAVLDRVRTSLTKCENGELMSIDIEN
ncbi:hypothetical protein P5673_021828 [Acropora cervicornis]|uniref:Uncharacterized protein n=1 Tax=Acropora cervicornis TaxID=6130 RepID=A0AAD9V023_ACRCE|nr:hypothetical protein P5673_021828 [Acropora cervicornis]